MTNDTVTPKKLTKKAKTEKSVPSPAQGYWKNPFEITLTVEFADGNRRVTPADLERAAEAGATAVRASLESRSTPYKIKAITGKVRYLYLAFSKTVSG
jgi:hypothetical protein